MKIFNPGCGKSAREPVFPCGRERRGYRLEMMSMSALSILFGVMLILQGTVGAYLASLHGAKAITAWIPAVFGLVILVLGLLARKESLRMHVMHAAMVVALIGFAMPGFMAAKAVLTGAMERPMAVIMQAIMAVICLAYLILGIRSFIAARRARALANP
jgi:peptidoglycan/LPS O-acetylase OafA/YrhL